MHEKRKSPRVSANVAIKIKEDDPLSSNVTLTTQTLNISAGGAYCPVSRFIPLFTRLQLTLLLPSNHRDGHTETEFISCQAVVVRVEPEEETLNLDEYRLGLLFSELDEKDRKKIHKFVMQCMEKSHA